MTRTMPFADRRHHPLTTAALIFLFWAFAAALVATFHIQLDVLSWMGGAAATLLAILGSAYLYTRICARCAGVDHALGVGIAWLVMTIVAEIAITTRVHHGWYSLIGSPAHPLLRNVFLFAWVFAPALFAHRGSDQ